MMTDLIITQEEFFTSVVYGAIDKKKSLVYCQATFSLQQYKDNLYGKHNQYFPISLERAVPKRRAEYLAGRFCAAHALNKLGSINLSVETSCSRAPSWPIGFIGSITHTNTCALAIVASNQDIAFVGVDMEEFISVDKLKGVESEIITDLEQSWLRNVPMSWDVALLIVFSAKESLYKALWPSVRKFFGFHSAELFSLDVENNMFRMRLTLDLAPHLYKGMIIDGHYRIDNERVYTFIFN